MKKETEKVLKESVKQGAKLSFAIAYWFIFGLFILIGWVSEGASLGITLAILFTLGYLVIIKMTKFFIKRAKRI